MQELRLENSSFIELLVILSYLFLYHSTLNQKFTKTVESVQVRECLLRFISVSLSWLNSTILANFWLRMPYFLHTSTLCFNFSHTFISKLACTLRGLCSQLESGKVSLINPKDILISCVIYSP